MSVAQRQAVSEADGWDAEERRAWGDGAEGARTTAKATGGISLGPAAAVSEAIAAVSALEGPKVLYCETCKASFHGNDKYQQHLAGPVHRKAVARMEANKQKAARLARHGAAAEAALGAAAWHSAQGEALQNAPTASSAVEPAEALPKHPEPRQWEPRHPLPRHGEAKQGAQHSRGRGAKGRGAAVQGTDNATSATNSGPRHEDLVAQARAGKEPLSIGGGSMRTGKQQCVASRHLVSFC
ncbi:unnamed protein product [Ostreobium quekettii]|uniref:C2H2-type domain-containing protein n=1 Tax=Ostreobium quekettii TaxID=121088 RepID=A0A8S1IKH2_9CHLO|nr:unnamed protein product [Ostreobium quekettii]